MYIEWFGINKLYVQQLQQEAVNVNGVSFFVGNPVHTYPISVVT